MRDEKDGILRLSSLQWRTTDARSSTYHLGRRGGRRGTRDLSEVAVPSTSPLRPVELATPRSERRPDLRPYTSNHFAEVRFLRRYSRIRPSVTCRCDVGTGEYPQETRKSASPSRPRRSGKCGGLNFLLIKFAAQRISLQEPTRVSRLEPGRPSRSFPL
jgi:hypothetical protein